MTFYKHSIKLVAMLLIVDLSLFALCFRSAIQCTNNGKRTECSPIRSVIIRVIINKIGRPRFGSLIC